MVWVSARTYCGQDSRLPLMHLKWEITAVDFDLTKKMCEICGWNGIILEQ